MADGAGSRKKAGIGAETAVNSVCDYIIKEFYNIYMCCEATVKTAEEQSNDIALAKAKLINCVVKSISEVVEKQCNIDDYASTLMFFACDKNKYVCGHIGDGVVGILRNMAEQNLTVLSKPENGGAPNITFFVTDSNANEHFRLEYGDMREAKEYC